MTNTEGLSPIGVNILHNALLDARYGFYIISECTVLKVVRDLCVTERSKIELALAKVGLEVTEL